MTSAGWDRNWTRLKQTLRLALVADDPSAHHALRRQLSWLDADWQVEVYTDAASALRDIPASPPHVVLMEVALPDLPGIECTKKLKAAVPDLPVVFYTARADSRTLLEGMMAGASGYLIKPVASAELVLHLCKAVMGGLALCARAEGLLLESLHRLGRASTRLGLSWREQESMLCLCQHRSHKECAGVLGISEATVHAHLARVYKKLHVHDRESAVRLFMGRLSGGGG